MILNSSSLTISVKKKIQMEDLGGPKVSEKGRHTQTSHKQANFNEETLVTGTQ